MFFVNEAAPLRWKLFVLDLPGGELKVYFSPAGIGRLVLPGCSLDPQDELLYTVEKPPWPGLEEELQAYFQGREIRGNYPLLAGAYAPWTLKVLQLTAAIPFGETRTYGEIARAAGKPRGARAAGRALGRNCTPLLIPCHRVIGQGNKLVGFGSGLAWKEKLLALEGHNF
ncbi:MAG: MGMT family protein [Bacillota bacterium]